LALCSFRCHGYGVIKAFPCAHAAAFAPVRVHFIEAVTGLPYGSIGAAEIAQAALKAPLPVPDRLLLPP